MIYTVKPGDSLSIIAAKFDQPYGAWKEIFQVNPQIGSNPDRIYPGQQLVIPPSWETGKKPAETQEKEIVPSKKMDYSWIYWGGGLFLLWLAYKKRGAK